MGHDVFISYATPDKPVADAICASLEQSGVRCWIAPRDVRPGEPWAAAIVRAIDGCRLMVLVVSDASGQSAHVLREVGQAADLNRVIVPFRLGAAKLDASLEYYLRTTHWLDAMTPPLSTHLERLRGVVADILRLHIHEQSTAPVLPRTSARVTVHLARFATSRKLYCFINVTNLRTDSEVEVTHVWIESEARVFACPPDRPLPRRLRTQESWETWVAVEDLGAPGLRPNDLFRAGRARFSTGEVVESEENVGVPEQGFIPGGEYLPPL